MTNDKGEAESLHARLARLETEIRATQLELRQRRLWQDGHRLSAGELQARHDYLKSQLDGTLRDASAHRLRVSDLEASVRIWIDGFNLASE